jgi:5-methylcytosine-specific restriction protein A
VPKMPTKPGAQAARDQSERADRNPPWTRDELILALDLYLRDPASPPGKSSVEVQELSDLLNKIGHVLGRRESGTFRNPNGVYMKLMNFRRFDPEYTRIGKVGLTRGNKEEGTVWLEFAHNRERLDKVANAIRKAVPLTDKEDISLAADDFVEAPEGRLLTRLHRSRERSRRLVEQRKRKALAEYGKLSCEVCLFDFEKCYGAKGRGIIEAHHIRPVETLVEGSRTRLEDLALLCANCHRMVHAARPWLTVDQLRSLVNS